MLTDIRSWCNDLTLADIVILNVYNLEQVANIGITVHDIRDFVDQVNDCLGHPVTWCSLATEHVHTRLNLLALFWAHLLQS